MVLKNKIKIFLSIIILVVFSLVLFFYLTVGFSYKYKNIANKYASEYKIEKSLVLAIIKSESNFNKDAISKKGAIGLMQIMPSTAKYICQKLKIDEEVNLYDAETNINLGVYYLKYLFDKFKDENIVICAYNAGERTVLDWLDENGNLTQDSIVYKETKKYLKKVKYIKSIYKLISYDD